MERHEKNAKRRTILKSIKKLCRRAEAIQSKNVGIDELQHLGFQSIRVGLNSNQEYLCFEPCFFDPLPSAVLAEHPINGGTQLTYLEDSTNYEDALLLCREESPDAPDLEEKARKRYERAVKYAESLEEPDYIADAREVETHISVFYRRARVGANRAVGLYGLDSIAPLKRADYEHGDGGWIEGMIGRSASWVLVEAYEDQDTRQEPHSLLWLRHSVVANDDSLTTGEVQCIMRRIYIWYGQKRFHRFASGPLLVLSFMGPKHARIIQAHHDGKNMVLQYSHLMSFQDKHTAPTSLLLRYLCSSPVG